MSMESAHAEAGNRLCLRSMSRTAVRVGCLRRRVTGVLEEWPSRLRACCPQAIQNPAYRLAGFKLRASGGNRVGRPPIFAANSAFHGCD